MSEAVSLSLHVNILRVIVRLYRLIEHASAAIGERAHYIGIAFGEDAGLPLVSMRRRTIP
jgi:hypothetical protein